MPSFDIVSEVDKHEITNAVDQANREIQTRFDLKETGARVEQVAEETLCWASADFQAAQVLDILKNKLIKRGIDIACLESDDHEASGKEVKIVSRVKEGLDQALCKKIVKAIKEQKMKVQVAIQGDKVRVTGKKRDDLQSTMAMLKEGDFEMPLQFNNFRD